MFTLREMQPSDGPAFGKLAYETPDTGDVQYRTVYQVDAYRSYNAMHPNMHAVVVEHPDHDGLVGAGVVNFEEVQINGALRPAAYLSSLMVHPAVRRQGLAGRIAQWRIQKAYEIVGKDAVVFAIVQSGNIGSQKNALKWADGLFGKFIIPAIKMRQSPPAPLPGITIREAEPEDYEEIAAHCNQYYEEYNLHPPLSAASIKEWTAISPLERPIKHWLVAADAVGNLVAGFQILEMGAMMHLEITKMPPAITAANWFMRVIPADRIMREIQIDNFWFAEGQEKAAAYLWDTLRYQWRERVTLPRLTLDVNNPLVKVLRISRWIPNPSGSVAVKSHVTLDPARRLNTII